MKYTTEQAVQKALSVSKLLTFGNSFVDMSHDELADFANLIRYETLLEAAEVATCSRFGSRIIEEVIAEELRRMAEEGK